MNRLFASGFTGILLALSIGRAEAQPNVLLIFTDDQRADTVHALGNPAIQTPNLDQLAESGMVFRNMYCMGGGVPAVCQPSRKMLLTGRSWFVQPKLKNTDPDFPSSMKEAGYLTHHFGKKGNTARRVHRKFDESFYEVDVAGVKSDLAQLELGIPGKVMADHAVAWLEKRKESGETRPFFMYLAGAAPHDPRLAPQAYLDRYPPEKMPLPKNFLPLHPFDNGELTIRDETLEAWPRTPEAIRGHLRDYYAVITHLDEQIGRIFDTLRKTGEYDNTLIIFTSDQGLAVGSHGLMGKQNLYEDGMRVPFIISGPGIPKGKTTSALAYLLDVFPTVCDLVGASVPPGLDGQSLAPVIRGETETAREEIFLAYRDVQRSIRREDWKLIQYPQVNITQVFNLKEDPHETQNLAGKYPEVEQELLAALQKHQARYGDTLPLTSETPRPADVTAEALTTQAAAPKKRK